MRKGNAPLGFRSSDFVIGNEPLIICETRAKNANVYYLFGEEKQDAVWCITRNSLIRIA